MMILSLKLNKRLKKLYIGYALSQEGFRRDNVSEEMIHISVSSMVRCFYLANRIALFCILIALILRVEHAATEIILLFFLLFVLSLFFIKNKSYDFNTHARFLQIGKRLNERRKKALISYGTSQLYLNFLIFVAIEVPLMLFIGKWVS